MRPSRLLPLLAAVAVLLVPLLAAPTASAAAAPTVTAVASDRGSTAGGSFVTLRGTNFTGVHTVAFGSTKTKNFRVWSSTEMTVRVPKHGAGTVYVRVARPGKASAASTKARYRYVTPTNPVLRPSGGRPAPAVSTVDDEGYLPVAADLSCTSATFCGAVGDLGLSVLDGDQWSAVTPTGRGTATPLVSCDDEFCMAYSTDGHRWRYQDGAWTDLGALAGVKNLSCVADRGGVCIAEAGQRAYLYRNGAWGGALNPVSGGVAGVSCTPTGCVVTSRTEYWRTYSFASNAWAAQRPMYATSALRSSSLTKDVTGQLQCTSTQWCLSLGKIQQTTSSTNGDQNYAILSGGQAWSIARVRDASNATVPNGNGRTQIKECQDGRCVVGTFFEWDVDGAGSSEWTVYDGTGFTAPSRTTPTRDVDALSCWQVTAKCRGFEAGRDRTVTG